jgi:hypothetical protein
MELEQSVKWLVDWVDQVTLVVLVKGETLDQQPEVVLRQIVVQVVEGQQRQMVVVTFLVLEAERVVISERLSQLYLLHIPIQSVQEVLLV